MASEETDQRIAVLQGTLDLIVLRTLQTMGAQHAYAIATRLQQISGDLLHLNQGTLYAITKAGEKALAQETLRWRRMSGLVEKLLSERA
jgi:PadR family transcriptional regulator PadR